MSEERAIQIIEAGQLAKVSPMDTLALMSDEQFEQRIKALKLYQTRRARIQRELMEPDVDYGVIPGTGNKPTLLKSGAEKLCKFDRLVPTFRQETIIGDGVMAPHIRVLSVCSLHYETDDGPIVGQGIGAANSWEKKYRYRDGQRKCPMCNQPSIFKNKKDDGWFCWSKKGGCGASFKANDKSITEQTQGQVENPDPYDTENTLEKMSAKRAYVDATLRATATSGLFSQDLEDMVDTEPANGHKAELPKQQTATQGPVPMPQQAQPATKPYQKPADPPTPVMWKRWEELWTEARQLGIKFEGASPDISKGDLIAKGQALKAKIDAWHDKPRTRVDHEPIDQRPDTEEDGADVPGIDELETDAAQAGMGL